MSKVISRPRIARTEELLLTGGDARILLEPRLNRNKYHCSPLPEPEVASFSSSTATSISAIGFEAADRLRRRIEASLGELSAQTIYAHELNRVRNELAQLSGVTGLAGVETVFCASGTDAHLIATQLAAGEETIPPLVIMMQADETGKGVPTAVNGRHFSSRSALGSTFSEGEPVAGAGLLEVASVPIRSADGTPRRSDSIDSDVESLALAAVKRGQRVLLFLLDQSKTGLIAPTPEYAASLKSRLPGMIDLLVDACQFRLAPSTMRGYLERGFMVALTGSKFLTGPAFSGALFIPAELTPRLSRCRLPAALSAYSARAEWPPDWSAASLLHDVANFGLLLRWEAALAELRAFRSVPEETIRQCLQEFATAVQDRLAVDPHFDPVPITRIDRGSLGDPASWDNIPSIFTFSLCRPTRDGGARVPLDSDETSEIYRLLQIDLPGTGVRSLLGQPVTYGQRDEITLTALRICSSSRLVVEAAALGGTAEIIGRVGATLDRVALLIDAGNGAGAKKTSDQPVVTVPRPQ